jgi:drug/metabolite transporter (DMT)-like permease
LKGALAGLFALWFAWGLNWSLWRIVLPYTGPLEFIALRTALAAALLVVLMLALRRSLNPVPLVPLLLIGLLQGVGMNGFSVIAVADSGATKATIFAYTMPFWTVLFARMILHEDIKARQWISVGLGALGLAIVIAGHGSRVSEVGAVFATAGGLCWALGTVVWKWTLQRYNVDPMLMITWQNLVAIIPLGVAALFAHEPPMLWNPLLTFVFIFNVTVTAIGSWLLWFWVVKRLPAVTAGMSALAIPVIAIITAYLLVGERPEPLQWIGIICMLLALLVVNLPSSENRAPTSSRAKPVPGEARVSRDSDNVGGQSLA